ncbi:hypothetical protein FRB98_008047 [Tulasnella sp. 332]|nr:hypothetical protein FRB98_008047 [Tulasnella sp. 332]
MPALRYNLRNKETPNLYTLNVSKLAQENNRIVAFAIDQPDLVRIKRILPGSWTLCENHVHPIVCIPYFPKRQQLTRIIHLNPTICPAYIRIELGVQTKLHITHTTFEDLASETPSVIHSPSLYTHPIQPLAPFIPTIALPPAMATQQPTYDQLLATIAALATQVASLTTNVNNLVNQPQPQVAAATHTQYLFNANPNPVGPSITSQQVVQLPPKGPKVAVPEKYNGKKRGDRAYEFIAACEQYIVLSAQQFASDSDLINWALGYLTEEAQKWALIIIKDLTSATPTIDTWGKFRQTFEHAFGDPDRTAKAETALRNLRQTGSAATYTAEFSKQAHHVTWNDQALISQYKLGLKAEIKLAKAAVGWANNLLDVQEEAITIDNRLFEAHAEERRQQPRPSAPPNRPPAPQQIIPPRNTNPYLQQVLRDRAQQRPPQQQQQQQQQQRQQPRQGAPRDPNAMEIDQGGRRRLTDAEKQRRRQAGACLRCGQMGHFARDCRAGPLAVNAGLDRRAAPREETREAREEARAEEMRAADAAAGRAFEAADAQENGQEAGAERQGNGWD